jgi:hypothetical protein
MPDLNERMRGVDHVPFSDDWDAIERRGPAPELMHDPTGSHAVKAIAVLAATLLVLGVALYSLSGLGSSTDGAPTGPSPESSSTAVYIDPAGIPITVDYPTNWSALSFTSASADGLSDGVEISNVEAIAPSPDPAGFSRPLNYVGVSIRASRQQVTSQLPDSPLPLSMDDSSVTLGPGNTRQLMARVGGVRFVIQVSAGPNASEADLATADAIVASIRPNAAPAQSVEKVDVPDVDGNTDDVSGPALTLTYGDAPKRLENGGSASYVVPTGTSIRIGGSAETIAWGWGPGSDPYDKPVPTRQQIPIVVQGRAGEHLALRLKAEWADGTVGEWSLQLAVTVPSQDELSLACPPDQRIRFQHSGAVTMPGGSAFITGNVEGLTLHDAVAQVTWSSGSNSWSGMWAVYREGSLVALIRFDGLSGVACAGSGVGGV